MTLAALQRQSKVEDTRLRESRALQRALRIEAELEKRASER